MLTTCDEPAKVKMTYMDRSPIALPTATRKSQGLKYDPNGPDRDCGDFDALREAQAFHDAVGGPDKDPH